MLKIFICCLMALFALAACSSKPTQKLSPEACAALKREQRISDTEKKLQEGGVSVIHSGQQTLLVLPADKFFFMDSSHLNGDNYATLNILSDYISLFDVETVKVGGYSDNCGNSLRAVALSRQQAQNIADYLKNQEVKAPIIYAIGYGCTFPIADNQRADGRAMNRRIQITFYRLDVKR
ncbi:MAG: Outer rane lipoprotein omp16 precursor [Gammaproteobacteria bacterium]|jgi:outer membrane protein OmpA-like peptidoglycan-associated protein|nr:Outer rane lipoprotein omp16 precursor [Gammaproteobacteria bacterium]